jgi:hypothetical protein
MKRIIYFLIVVLFTCIEKKIKIVEPIKLDDTTDLPKITKKVEKSFSLEKFPEFAHIVYDIEANYTIIPEYFESEVRKKGNKSGREYLSNVSTNCSGFIPKKNLFRFRFSGEEFDLHLYFLYKVDNFFYLTNSDQTKIIKLKILNRFIPKGANQEYIDSFELLSETNKLIASAQPTDFKSYEDCIHWTKETSEAIRNTSPDIFD